MSGSVKKIKSSVKKTLKNPIRGLTTTPRALGLKDPAALLEKPKPVGGGGGNTSLPVPVGQEQYYDKSGRPILKEFDSKLNPQGLLGSQYQVQDTLDRRGLEAVRTEALRDPGTQSKWAEMAKAQQMNDLAGQQASQLSTAQSNLAMQGGLRTGARERLASQNMQSGLLARQNVGAQINMQDELNRQKWLGMLPDQELQTAQYQGNVANQNIDKSLQELNRGRAYDMSRYAEGMKGWAAQKTANAVPVTEDKGFLGNLFGGLF